ncbi:MAG: rhodanese-like domain-containing protein [Patescibacteria group bacterium]
MKHITVDSFKEVILAEGNNPFVDFINVCTSAEYKEKHIPGVRSVPLDEIERHLDEFRDKKTVYVHCRSGRRGVTAIETLTALGVQAELVNVEGGILAWEEAGHEMGSPATCMPWDQ